MSSHQTIESSNSLFGLSDPDIIEGEGIRIEINVAEFLWADDIEEACTFYDKVIEYAKRGKKKLRGKK